MVSTAHRTSLKNKPEFAREHQILQQCHLGPLLFTDESYIHISLCDRCVRVQRKLWECFAAYNFVMHDAFDRGSLMVCGRMSSDGCMDLDVLQSGHINAQRYRNDLLEPTVRLYAGAVDGNIIVKHDNARPHTVVRTSTRRV